MLSFLNKPFKTVSMSQAKSELDNDTNIKLIDVRTKDEHRSGHIKGSINIPLDSINNAAKAVENKDSKVFVYCLSGARSRVACYNLVKMGYTDVTNMGGISSWKYEVVRG